MASNKLEHNLNDQEDTIILVDAKGAEVGTYPKLAAHKDGRLHRAFSIFIFNSLNELLIQKRNENKYHSGGLWTNTCCSHPRPNETVLDAATRRLSEEMGLATELAEVLEFTYKVTLPNGLIENEYDHVIIGFTDATPIPSADEVSSWRWVNTSEVLVDTQRHPETYTSWFPIALKKLKENNFLPDF